MPRSMDDSDLADERRGDDDWPELSADEAEEERHVLRDEDDGHGDGEEDDDEGEDLLGDDMFRPELDRYDPDLLDDEPAESGDDRGEAR
eukprot:SM006893S20649  [mRNA]  locus=s6893:29:410:- [translate_table: standard]